MRINAFNSSKYNKTFITVFLKLWYFLKNDVYTSNKICLMIIEVIYYLKYSLY